MVKVILGLIGCLISVGSASAVTIEYKVSLFHLPIGRATFEEKYSGTDAVEIETHGRTNSLGSLIYSVNNYYICSIDRFDSSPIRLVKLISEKSVRESTVVSFDAPNNQVRYGDRVPIRVPEGTQTFFSALHLLRKLNPPSGKAEFPIIAHGKLWRAICRWEREERIEMEGRPVDCRVIMVGFVGIDPSGVDIGSRPDILSRELVHPKAEISLWLTEGPDPRYVRAEFKRSPFKIRLTIAQTSAIEPVPSE